MACRKKGRIGLNGSNGIIKVKKLINEILSI